MRALLLLAACFLAAPHISGLFAHTGVSANYWANGALMERSTAKRYPDGRVLKHGTFSSFHRNGAKQSEGRYHEGKREGSWTWWYDSGEVFARCAYHDDEGVWTGFDRDGNRRWQGPFRGGSREGLWREWDATGALRKEGEYDDDQPHGPWQYWNPGEELEYEELVWRHGTVIEQQGEVVDSGGGRRLDLVEHLGQSALLLLFVLAPLPLALWSVAPARGAGHNLLLFCTSWLCVLSAGVVALGFAQSLHRLGLLGLSLLLVIVGGVGLRRLGDVSTAARLRSLLPRAPWSTGEAVLLMALVVLGATATWDAIVQPISDWDSMAYHLPLVARWAQAGAFVDLPELGQLARYPFHVEALSAAFTLVLREDALVAAPVLLAWSILGLALFGLVRRAGADRAAALATALFLLSMPLLLVQTEELKTDLPLVAAFAASLYFGGFLARRDDEAHAPVFWMSLGLLAGIKSSGPLYAGLALAGVACCWWWRRSSRAPEAAPNSSSRRGRMPLVLASIVAFFLATIWYLRNLIELGNPLGYVQGRVLGLTFFDGPLERAELARTTLAAVFQAGSGAHWKIFGGVVWEWLGLPFVILALVALLGLPVLLWARPSGKKRQTNDSSRREVALLVAIALLCGVAYLMTPYGGDNGTHDYQLTPWIGGALRYGFPFVLMLAVLAGKATAALRVRSVLWVGLGAVMAILGVTLTVVTMPTALWAIVLGTLLAVSGLASSVWSRQWPRFAPAILMVILGLGAVGSLYGARHARGDLRPEYYGDAYRFVESRTSPGQTIAYAMTEMRFPLYGGRLDRELVSAISYEGDGSIWLESLLESGADFLMIGIEPTNRLHGRLEQDIRPWADASERLQLVQDFGEGPLGLAVYRIEAAP